jgi:hypothetical protein
MRVLGNTLLFLWIVCPVWAQSVVGIHPGVIGYAGGEVYFDRKVLDFKSTQHQNLEKEQKLQTLAGKVEVQLGPVVTLWMGNVARLRMVEPDITNTTLRIEEG